MEKTNFNKNSFFVLSIYNNILNDNRLSLRSPLNKCKKGFSFDIWFYLNKNNGVLFLQKDGIKLYISENMVKFYHSDIGDLLKESVKVYNKSWYNILFSYNNESAYIFLNGNIIFSIKIKNKPMLLSSNILIGDNIYIRMFRLYNVPISLSN